MRREQLCANCGKQGSDHSSVDRACPLGRRSRTLSYTSYHRTATFAPRRSGAERRAEGTPTAGRSGDSAEGKS